MASKASLTRFVTRSSVTGLVLVLISVGLFYCGATRSSVTAQTILAGIASMIGTAGLVSIIQDSVLKQALVRDLMTVVELAERVKVAGLTDIKANASGFDWSSIFDRGTRYQIMLMDPLRSLSQELQLLLDAAQKRPIEVHIFLSDATPSLAHGEISGVTETAVRLAETWRRRGDAIHEKSSLKVTVFEGPVPTAGCVLSDRDLVLTLPSPLGLDHDPQAALAVFEGGSDSPVEAWAKRTFENLRSCTMIEGVPARRPPKSKVELPAVNPEQSGEAESNGDAATRYRSDD